MSSSEIGITCYNEDDDGDTLNDKSGIEDEEGNDKVKDHCSNPRISTLIKLRNNVLICTSQRKKTYNQKYNDQTKESEFTEF